MTPRSRRAGAVAVGLSPARFLRHVALGAPQGQAIKVPGDSRRERQSFQFLQQGRLGSGVIRELEAKLWAVRMLVSAFNGQKLGIFGTFSLPWIHVS